MRPKKSMRGAFSVFALALAAARPAPTVTVAGHRLVKIGEGVRVRFFLDVYTLAAYTQSGRCDARALIETDEPKLLRIRMLRSVPAALARSALLDALKAHLPRHPPASLVAQVKTLVGWFGAGSTRGDELCVAYLPGVGTTVTRNGAILGPPLSGFVLAHVVWDAYFGDRSCCEHLKSGVLRCGR